MLKKKGKAKVLTIQSAAKAACGCTHQCRCTVVGRYAEYDSSFTVNRKYAMEGIEWS